MPDPILKGVSHKMDWDILALLSDLGPRYVKWCLVFNSELLEFTLQIKLLVSIPDP
jgi:hypothetical protein